MPFLNSSYKKIKAQIFSPYAWSVYICLHHVPHVYEHGLAHTANKRIQCTKTGAVLYSNPSLLDKLHHRKLWLAVISIANMIWNILPAYTYETLNRCVFMWVVTLGNSLSGNIFSWLTCSFIWQKDNNQGIISTLPRLREAYTWWSNTKK